MYNCCMTQKLLAFDLETTGLDTTNHQILEIGAVAFTTEGEILGEFQQLIRHPAIVGDPYAIEMNLGLILGQNSELMRMGTAPPLSEYFARRGFESFLTEHFGEKPPTPVGFNVAAFDVSMYNRGVYPPKVLGHRCVELGSLLMPVMGYSRPVKSSEAIPALLGKEVGHRALEDAQDAVALYMMWQEWANMTDQLAYPAQFSERGC